MCAPSLYSVSEAASAGAPATSAYTHNEMRLYLLQSSEGNLRVAMRSSHSWLPSAWATLEVDRILSECWPSFLYASESAISPSPLKDQCESSSMLSSRRESSTFLFSQRYSAPSAR